ncbi:TIGR00269 family protein [Methanofollis fontis]|uniref:TIGR00269 family protein n=1 Tax=Methanofollis fontis TaxID=2052832 RepID=A0A483CZJ6_9EURY|nr:TIGR00269 family protein [Methanofollis fontis]TAJ45822.1 TIGR00269 family protein [Methanofollis fontis]
MFDWVGAMQCSKCRREAVVLQRYSGLHLCRDHFIADLEAKAKREIRQKRMIVSGDVIAVALSGGKDSSALLRFLTRTFGERRDVSILALTVDEGIAGYRHPEQAHQIAEACGVPWHCVTFQEIAGTTTDRIVEMRGDALSCTYCGVIRRHCLNTAARDLGATKLAMGMNLDDEAQSVLMNVLRGDAERLIRRPAPLPGVVRRIKPFAGVPEREVALYAHLTIGRFEEASCPYAHNALRSDVRAILNEYAWRHPATKYALKNLGDQVPEICNAGEADLQVCPECGEPFSGVCRSCQLIREARGG